MLPFFFDLGDAELQEVIYLSVVGDFGNAHGLDDVCYFLGNSDGLPGFDVVVLQIVACFLKSEAE